MQPLPPPTGVRRKSRINRRSITTKLAAIVLVFVCIVLAVLAMVSLGFAVSNGVRAYVGAEGAWSKGQRDAVYYLTRYARTRDEQDYRQYLAAIAIPLGDRAARLEMEKSDYDYDAAKRGLAQGDNSAADLPYMIFVFRNFRDVPQLAQAIRLWTEADVHIAELMQSADELHAAVNAGTLSTQRTTMLLNRIEAIHTELAPLEHALSVALGEGARWVRDVLLIAIFCTAVLLLLGGLWVAWRIAEGLRAGIAVLRDGALRVAHGDLVHPIAVRTSDELGDLATAFNSMIVQRRDAEDALKESEWRARRVIDTAYDAFVAIDATAIITAWNPQAERLFGWSRHEAVGRNFTETIIPPQYRQAYLSGLQNFLKTGEGPLLNKKIELSALHHDGSEIPVELSLWAVHSREGLSFNAFIQDLTLLKEEEAAMRKEGALQRAIFNSANFSSIATDAKGVIQIFNVGAERMLGYTAAEVMNKITPADISDPQEVIVRAKALSLELGTPITPGFEALVFKASRGIEDIYELTYIRKDGSRFPAIVSVTALRDAAKIIIGYLLIGTDNTVRKQNEIQLHWAEESFRLMVESVTDFAIIQLDTRGNVLSWNLGAQRIQGYSASEIIGKNFACFYPAESLREGKPARELEITARDGRFEEETWRLRKDGTRFLARVVITAVRDAAGLLLGFGKVTRDITQLKQAEAELRQARDEALQASRAKSEFLANMSHEIRTPMNGVIGMTEVLLETPLPPAQRDAVETIRFSGQSLLTIINDILDFSKMEAGMLRLDIVELNVQRVLDRVLAIFAEPAANKGLKLKQHVDAGLPPVLRGDPGRLHQVLTNLVANALKFTEHGEVHVSASLERASDTDAMVRFTVHDSGAGISIEAQQRLFQPFMQADSSTTRKYGGSGLGLAISRQLAELMDGEMGVESKLGKGSSFWFTARLEISTAAVKVLPETPMQPLVPAPPVLTGRWRVLVAEDNPVNQRVACHQLERLGLKADVVDNGRAVLGALQRQRYDLILMDCQMPELDGYAATAEIRRNEGSDRHTWIVAMTAHAMGGDREKCLAAGMDDYLAKPVTTQALREALQRFEQRAAAPPMESAGSQARAHPHQPTGNDPPVNLTVLRDAADGDPVFMRDLAELFVVQTREQLNLLHAAVVEGLISRVQSIAHRCKGGSSACGATKLASLFHDLERLGRGQNLAPAQPVVAEIEHEFARVQTFLSAQLLAQQPEAIRHEKYSPEEDTHH